MNTPTQRWIHGTTMLTTFGRVVCPLTVRDVEAILDRLPWPKTHEKPNRLIVASDGQTWRCLIAYEKDHVECAAPTPEAGLRWCLETWLRNGKQTIEVLDLIEHMRSKLTN